MQKTWGIHFGDRQFPSLPILKDVVKDPLDQKGYKYKVMIYGQKRNISWKLSSILYCRMKKREKDNLNQTISMNTRILL